MRVRFVTPRRPDGGRRDELWAFCRSWWTDRFDWPIYEADTEGRFNRGAAINRGAEGEWDVLVIIDGDVVAEASQVQAAVMRANATGRLCFAYDEYVPLERAMSDRVLKGYSGNWVGRQSRVARSHVSSIVVVPRALWDEADGFDERCEGWGHDDTIFAHVARVLGGGCERVPGKVFHLWHPTSPHAAQGDPWREAAGLLAKRYFAAVTPEEVRSLVAERHEGGVSVVIPTNGRRDCIESAVDSLHHLKGAPISGIWISDDSGDIEYHAWLRWRFPGAHVLPSPRRTGYAPAMLRAQAVAIAAGQPWVWWMEDDFVIEEDVDLGLMQHVLRNNPTLTQIMLRRQAWFPEEVEAGGFVERNPHAYEGRREGKARWLEHSLGHWMNPHLTTREFLIGHPWPQKPHSERIYGQALARKGRRFAIWGERDDPPKVMHIGERTGHGY